MDLYLAEGVFAGLIDMRMAQKRTGLRAPGGGSLEIA